MFPAPRLAIASLDKIMQAHPYARSGAIARSPRAETDSSSVWERLFKCSNSQLTDCILALSDLEVSLALYGSGSRYDDARTVNVLSLLFELRKPNTGDRIAWQALLLSDGDPIFRTAAKRFLEENNSPWRVAADVESPLAFAAGTYLNARAKFADFFEPDLFPGWHARIGRELKRRLLSATFVDRTLAKEGVDVLDKWLNEVYIDSERVEWFRLYLEAGVETRRSRSDPVLKGINARFGEPAHARSFWKHVSPAAISAYQIWLRDLQLTRALGEGERLQFWRAYLDRMTRSQESRNGTAVLICFRGWFAVQFKEMGKATYLFNQKYFAGFQKLDDVTLYWAVRNNPSLDRYTHQGSYWQYSARGVVDALLELY